MNLSKINYEDVWLRAFSARATVVVQQQMLTFSAEQCARFADEAVAEAKKRRYGK